ncbi:hypothetical protein M4951_17340 [Blastopirellula sp. J2-11]|uniref:hypothetical protein n=1 Tax=Blastopirellula sp. J2-11 TaxID=2943192 RepID=UPI0021C95CC2|nr:hypothetical protein [Blastopirellula sp. J2-11]UUO05140.1 hypothetical protein M4951_17340 [Blastopirellula sp. J2-11]
MNTAQFQTQFQRLGRWIVLGAATVALTIAYAGPSISGSGTAAAPASQTQEVAWRGGVYRRAYGPVYRGYGYNRGYGPIYGPGYNTRPFYRPIYGGGAVITPYARVYW